ncbi:MAG: hypothetical protein LBH45_02350 [Campylobacteraceae bacterium]|jgi:hypothetical protein|nr:hypothetical protein [Campylobacteraceae bacterium]
MKPLEVTVTIASWVRTVSNMFDPTLSRLNGLDTFAVCGDLPQDFG